MEKRFIKFLKKEEIYDAFVKAFKENYNEEEDYTFLWYLKNHNQESYIEAAFTWADYKKVNWKHYDNLWRFICLYEKPGTKKKTQKVIVINGSSLKLSSSTLNNYLNDGWLIISTSISHHRNGRDVLYFVIEKEE